jgi:hypothetical protein
VSGPGSRRHGRSDRSTPSRGRPALAWRLAACGPMPGASAPRRRSATPTSARTPLTRHAHAASPRQTQTTLAMPPIHHRIKEQAARSREVGHRKIASVCASHHSEDAHQPMGLQGGRVPNLSLQGDQLTTRIPPPTAAIRLSQPIHRAGNAALFGGMKGNECLHGAPWDSKGGQPPSNRSPRGRTAPNRSRGDPAEHPDTPRQQAQSFCPSRFLAGGTRSFLGV